MKKQNPLINLTGELIPTGVPAPIISRTAHESIKRADEARAEIARMARFYIMGGNNSPEALRARGYEPSRKPEPNYDNP